MARSVVSYLIALLALAGLLVGCRFELETREPWRAEAEQKCLAEKGVVPSAFLEPLSALDGKGACGMDHPFQVHAFSEGNVVLEPTGKLACPVIRETDLWLAEVVQPAAMAWMGQPVTAIRHMSAYSCRGMNGDPSARISEHAFGNALDIGAFRFADGRWVSVKNGWRGSQEERGFLLQVQAGACERFTTVLAPGSNIYHYDHIHIDLMRRATGRSVCKPAPRPLPAPPMMTKAPQMPPQLAPLGPAPQPAIYAPPPGPPEPPYARGPVPSTPDIVHQPAPDLPPQAPPARPRPALPPGWDVGPDSLRPPGPMSYAPAGGSPGVTGSVAPRKYYTVPVPQASTVPLPQAKPGED